LNFSESFIKFSVLNCLLANKYQTAMIYEVALVFSIKIVIFII